MDDCRVSIEAVAPGRCEWFREEHLPAIQAGQESREGWTAGAGHLPHLPLPAHEKEDHP